MFTNMIFHHWLQTTDCKTHLEWHDIVLMLNVFSVPLPLSWPRNSLAEWNGWNRCLSSGRTSFWLMLLMLTSSERRKSMQFHQFSSAQTAVYASHVMKNEPQQTNELAVVLLFRCSLLRSLNAFASKRIWNYRFQWITSCISKCQVRWRQLECSMSTIATNNHGWINQNTCDSSSSVDLGFFFRVFGQLQYPTPHMTSTCYYLSSLFCTSSSSSFPFSTSKFHFQLLPREGCCCCRWSWSSHAYCKYSTSSIWPNCWNRLPVCRQTAVVVVLAVNFISLIMCAARCCTHSMKPLIIAAVTVLTHNWTYYITFTPIRFVRSFVPHTRLSISSVCP